MQVEVFDAETRALTDARPDRADAPTSKSFVLTFLLTFALVYLLFIVINWLGNDTALFPSPLRPAVTERPWKTRRIDAQAKAGSPPTIIVFGSSRVMQIQPAYLQGLTGGKAFNYGLSAGGFIDTLTQLRYLASRGIAPKIVILGIDEFAFSSTTSHHKLQLAAHPGLLVNIPFPENLSLIGQVVGNVTPDSTWRSFLLSFQPLGPRHESFERASTILLSDGYLIYKQSVELKEAGNYPVHDYVMKGALRFAGRMRSLSAAEDPTIIRPRQWEMFEQILDLARARQADVRVVLLPVHPDFEKVALNQRELRMRAKISRMMAAACARRDCQYRDFTSLASYGGNPNEFWDGMHQTPENSRRMMNVLFGQPPEKIVVRVPSDVELLRTLPAGNSLDTW